MSDKFIWILFMSGWAIMLFGFALFISVAVATDPIIGAGACIGVGMYLIYALQYKDGKTPRINPYERGAE